MQSTPPITTLQLSLLGPWEARTDHGELPALPTRHTRTLLARLALAHPQPISRAQLARDLFPEAQPANATRHLRVTLHYLRQALGAAVVADGETLALDRRLTITHDLGQFFSLSGPEATPTMLRTALALYRGPLLERPTSGWAAQHAEQIHEHYIALLRRLLALAQASQSPREALDLARRWVETAPWQEEAHLALLRALVDCGWRREAEKQLQRSAARLRGEWGDEAGATFVQRARVMVGRGPKGHSDAPEQLRGAGLPERSALLELAPGLPRGAADGDCATVVLLLLGATERGVDLLQGEANCQLHDHLRRSRVCLERDMRAAAELHLGAAIGLARQAEQSELIVVLEAALTLLLGCAGQPGVTRVGVGTSDTVGLWLDVARPRAEAPTLAAEMRDCPCCARRVLRALRGLAQARLAELHLSLGLELLRDSVTLAQIWGGIELWRVQVALATALLQHHQHAEGVALAETVLGVARGQGRSAALAQLLAALARALGRMGEHERALALADQSWQMAEALGAPEQVAYGLSVAAEQRARAGQLQSALALAERAEQCLERQAPESELLIGPIVAPIFLAAGRVEQARRLARQTIARARPRGHWAFLAPEALAVAAEVLATTDSPAAARPVQARAYQYLLDQLAGLGCPDQRRAYLTGAPAFERLTARGAAGPRRLALLPSERAPTTRALRSDELIPVIWTLRATGGSAATPAGRREQIMALAREAAGQGACPAVEALADILAVSPRTILLDLQTIRSAGFDIRTRGSRQRGQAVAA